MLFTAFSFAILLSAEGVLRESSKGFQTESQLRIQVWWETIGTLTIYEEGRGSVKGKDSFFIGGVTVL